MTEPPPNQSARGWAVVGDELHPLTSGTDLHSLFDALPLGVYTALRTFGRGRFLRLDDHLARTRRSMAALGWTEPLHERAARHALDRATALHPAAEARVRLDVLERPIDVPGGSTRLLVAVAPWHAVPAALLERGVGVAVAPALRRPEPRIKRARFVLERRPFPLGEPDAYEHLLLDSGQHILEGSSSNFFGVKQGVLSTAGDGVLEGVTAKIVCELLPAAGLRVERAAPRLSEATSLDEAFITSSTRGLVPVIAVDGARVGDGRPGPWTRRLTEAYDALAEREARPAV